MVIDFYELTMAQGYFDQKRQADIVYFDLFFRRIPDAGGYAIFAGLDSIISYIQNFHFGPEDIEYLRGRQMFTDDFLSYLEHLTFTGNIYAFKEGSVMFPNEPILRVEAPLIQAQLIETYLLQVVNHQSLIATKASRIKYAAQDKAVLEFGARRAHGLTSSVLGARAAYIGGVDATSNVLADQHYNIPALGTMAHSWVQLFDSEYDAFKAYAASFPNHATFLVDTYDTLQSGVPNAIAVIQKILLPQGAKNYGIRIDSGDLTYLSKQARKMLDEAGLRACNIVVSNALDERLIKELLAQGAPIDVFGVGERLITAKSDPVFGAVYKLVALQQGSQIVPKIKISDNLAKITTPHVKQVYRIYTLEGKAEADYITLKDEVVSNNQPLTIFDPIHPWKEKTFKEYKIKPLLEPIFMQGKLVYDRPSLLEIRQYTQSELNTLWEEMRRFDYPHKYYVDLSKKVWDIKQELLKKR
jgi:nicotinate phosphoribosyltransferase